VGLYVRAYRVDLDECEALDGAYESFDKFFTRRLKPGQRFGFHRHVLNYFWTAVTACRGRQHLMDGTTVEYSYAPGETRHETYGSGEFKVHDLENIGDGDMVFMTVEFLESANRPLAIPDEVRAAAA